MSGATESEVAALREQIDVLEAVIEKQANRIDLLLKNRAEDRQRIAELEEYRADNEHDKATIRQQVTQAGQDNSTADDKNTAQNNSRRTPMEQLIHAGEAGVIGRVTASVERAEVMARHFSQWASKTPNGLVVKDNLKNLLETATEEKLAWNQVYRAARALEEFTNEAVRFEKHRRHGWMLVAKPAIVAALSRASSVGER